MVKRVLHYVGKMDFGGMEAMIMNLYRNINRDEWQFDFAVHSDKKGCYEDEIVSLGGRIYRFPAMRRNPFMYKQCWKIFWQQHKNEYEVFQMHTNSLANIIALQTATEADIPKRIVHAHSAYANKGKLQFLNDILHKYNRNRLGKYANLCFACSELAADWMFGHDSLKSGKAIILNNGVDYNRFAFCSEKRVLLRENLGLSNKITLIQVGSLLPVKNHQFTIKVIKRLVEFGNTNLVCLFMGDGPLRQSLEEIVQKEDLGKYIIFLGAKSNIEDYLSSSDIFLMPSLYEGMPLSVVEAQVSGLKCLISDSITKMAKVSNNVDYLSIEDVNAWSEYIIKARLNEARSNLSLDNRLNIINTSQIYTEYLLK